MSVRDDSVVIQANEAGSSILFGVIITNLLIVFLRWGNDEWWWSIVLIIISILSLRPIYVGNETLILSEKGIIVEDGRYKRQYLWNELPVKRLNSTCIALGRGTQKHCKCIVFSKNRFLRPKFFDPIYIKMVFNRSIFCIYIRNMENKGNVSIGSFQGCMDEKTIAEKLQEWHVELEGDELGKPPWKEFL